MSAYHMHEHGLTFDVPGNPIPKERARTTRRGTFTPARTRAYETLVGMHAMLAAATWAKAYRRKWDVTGRYAVSVTVHRATAHRCDLTNVGKAIEDGAQGSAGLWADDSQLDDVHIVRGSIDRTSPRVTVTVRRLTPVADSTLPRTPLSKRPATSGRL